MRPLTIHSATINHDPDLPPRVALRWSLRATHDGFGVFGPPHRRAGLHHGVEPRAVRGSMIRQEWMLIDEVAVWKQIIAHTQSRAGA